MLCMSIMIWLLKPRKVSAEMAIVVPKLHLMKGKWYPDTEVTESATVVEATAITHYGIEVIVEFKPVEHPIEPHDNDQPIHCPLPEPSILNDGRIWKERVCAGVQSRADMSIAEEGVGVPPEHKPLGTKSQRRANRTILPSISAPEHNILKLLEECNASGM